MKNIVSILRQADEDSLVLLDELGAGTDPQEGAALGLSIIEALLESEAYVAISTHLTPLKFFAIRHPPPGGEDGIDGVRRAHPFADLPRC